MNVSIHHQWASLFTLHMDSESQIFNSNDASSNNFHFDNEKLHCTLTYLMIHNFLEVPKIMDYENTIYFVDLSQHFHSLGLFKNKHSKEISFPTLFYGQP